MRTRFYVGSDLPPFSADATLSVYDGESDNGDTLVHVDPQNILTPNAAENLAVILAAAMNAAQFAPAYPKE